MRENNFITYFSSSNMSLFYGLLTDVEAKESEIPRFFPFEWGLNLEKGLFQQKPNNELINILRKIYESTVTIAPPICDDNLGGKWAETILDSLSQAMEGNFEGKRILEIGCSNGFILKRLKELGAICVGVEPGPQGKIAKEKFGLDIKISYFEDTSLDSTFDLIYSINVLEHVFDLNNFMNKVLSLIKKDGVFFVAVPNSSLEMSIGSPNMFVHEHWWYFTPESLKLFLLRLGLIDVKVIPSLYGSNFFSYGRCSEIIKNNLLPEKFFLKKLNDDAIEYLSKKSCLFNSMQIHINEIMRCGKDIALYGASNAINFIGLLDWKKPPLLLDSDSANHGKFLWFKDILLCIESPEILVRDFPEEIWVLPVAHQLSIKEFLLNYGVPAERIFLLEDFLLLEDNQR